MANEVISNEENTPDVVLLNNVNGFRQLVTFVSETLCSDDDVARIYTKIDEKDGMTYWCIETSSGVSSVVDCMLGSKLFNRDVWVHAKDLIVACMKMEHENVISMWIDENELYLGAFFNEKLGAFELQVALPMVEPVEIVSDLVTPDDRIDIDQIALATIGDSLYNFESVEIWRKNGVVSYRTGNEKICLATVMQSETMVSVDDSSPDLSIKMPAKIFKAIPYATNDAMCTIVLDTEHKLAKVSNEDMTIVVRYSDGELNTITSAGMVDFVTMDSIAVATTIDMLFGINYTDPTGLVTLSADESGAMIFECSNKRVSVALCVGEVIMHEKERSITIPLDVLTMMIRNTQCKELTLKVDFDHDNYMLGYTNGLFARKCTYIQGE